MPAELPRFSLDNGFFWTAAAQFPSWTGFQSRRAGYGSRDSAAASDGFVRIVFAPEGRGKEPLSNEELSAIRWVLEHEASMSKALLSSLFKAYPSLQEQYGYSDEEKAEFMPHIET